MIEATVYASISKESLYKLASDLDLPVDAINTFVHFDEVSINISIDEKTGIVEKAKVIL